MTTLSKIRVLNDQTINKIAAGEVIENPASVVKELVENSIDAGATAICIEIQEGGRQLIRISDNGCGMSPDDALLCLERHATSKIREVEDIEEVITMGFRGEAVPSIAAISKFTLLTQPRSDEEKGVEGTLIIVDGGRLLSCKSAVRSPGTTIEVKSLFFNVPVRRKFQKSPSYDHQEVVRVVGLLALANPTIQFELISDQKTFIKTPTSSPETLFHDLFQKRVECILGKEYASSLIPIHFKQGNYELIGYIGSPSSHKPNRKGQYLFINHRSVFSPIISSSVREGYGTMLPTQRYPLFALHLRMPGSLLDVNVHPQKREVRLRQENQLKDAIIQAVQGALRQEQKPLPSHKVSEAETAPPYWAPYASLLSPPPKFVAPVSSEKWEFRSVAPAINNPESLKPLISDLKVGEETREELPLPSPSQPFLQPKSETKLPMQMSTPSIIGTLFGYCILEPFELDGRLLNTSVERREGGLFLLDQRAALSRINFEKLLKRSATKESQSLLIPLTLHFSPSEFQAIQNFCSLLNEMGFGIREFGESSFLIDAHPLFIKESDLENCLHLLVHEMVEMESSRYLQTKLEEHLALAAIRASLPSAKRLSIDEAQALVKQLLACEIPSQCPAGKPTCIYLSPDELAKLFLKKGTSVI